MGVSASYIHIAKLGKTHGLSGMLHIYFNVDILNTSFKVVFVEEKIGYVPHFIKAIEVHGDKGFVNFEDVDSKESAQHLVNKKVYFTSEKFNHFFKETEDDLLELVGYTAYNGSMLIGEITEIYDNTSQLLAEIKHNQETHLVPLVEDFIISIDDVKKKVIMELPEGILTL